MRRFTTLMSVLLLSACIGGSSMQAYSEATLYPGKGLGDDILFGQTILKPFTDMHKPETVAITAGDDLFIWHLEYLSKGLSVSFKAEADCREVIRMVAPSKISQAFMTGQHDKFFEKYAVCENTPLHSIEVRRNVAGEFKGATDSGITLNDTLEDVQSKDPALTMAVQGEDLEVMSRMPHMSLSKPGLFIRLKTKDLRDQSSDGSFNATVSSIEIFK